MANVVLFAFPEPLSDSSHRQHYIECEQPMWAEFMKACGGDKPNLQTVTELRSAIALPDVQPVIITGHSRTYGGDVNAWLRKYVKRDQQFTILTRPNDFFGNSIDLREMWYKDKLKEHTIIAVHEHFTNDREFWSDKIGVKK